MNIRKPLAALCCLALTALAMPPVLAGDGHDHGEAPVATGGPALPRFTAESELFELVGVVNGKQITLYLDRFADGRPVKDAKLELEIGGVKVPVELHAEGEFEVTLAQELKPGVVAVAATVMAGDETDLLAGELDLHEEAATSETPVHGGKEYATWLVAGLAGLALLILMARRLRASRESRIGGVA